MHDIWNPWHGCIKCSEGCKNCYMYYLDRKRGKNGADIYRTKTNFNYPLKKDKTGAYKIKSGELIRVCMTSDFFLKEADTWREEAWDIMHMRSDVKFFLLTKRPERVRDCLPKDWGDGWENIFLNVSVENQKCADKRIPILLDLPFKHKGIMAAPLLEAIHIEDYLATGILEQVICGGENYGGARPCNFDWITSLSEQCENEDISCYFIETGTQFIKDGKMYQLPSKRLQSEMAYKSKASYIGKPMEFILKDPIGNLIPEEALYTPTFTKQCETCGMRPICNGDFGDC